MEFNRNYKLLIAGFVLGLITMLILISYIQYESVYLNYFLEHRLYIPKWTDLQLDGEEDLPKPASQSNRPNDRIQSSARFFSMSVTEDDIENFSVVLPPTIFNFKNPCWMEKVPEHFSYYSHNLYYEYHKADPTFLADVNWDDGYAKLQKMIAARQSNESEQQPWRLRCFPYFFLPGFTKCGTTDLFAALSRLPDFFGALAKEPEFWNYIRIAHNPSNEVRLPEPTLASYLDLFDLAAENIRQYVKKTENGTDYHPGITGDFDPQTIWRIADWRQMKGNENKTEPRYMSSHHLYRLSPQTKFIILLRNPVERTFSHYKHFGVKGNYFKPELFHQDIKEALHTLDLCFGKHTIRYCVYQALIPDINQNLPVMRSILGSLYHVFIEDWITVFPREQFLFIKSEDYFQNRTAIIEKIVKFLEMDTSIPINILQLIERMPIINRSSSFEMLKKTRSLLEDFFKSTNNKLSTLLHDDKWLWI